jgi:phage N-6-adenine-methyltransferase
MLNAGLFTSARGDWATPQEVYDALDAEFGPFTLDPCASPENAKCETFYDTDGLTRPWNGRVFVNPPYGRAIGAWVERCYEASLNGAEVVVGLLPSRTDTKWWHSWVMKANEIRFIRGRLRFGGAKQGAPFPSAVVIWQK